MSADPQARRLEYGRALAEFLEDPEREEARLSAYDFGRRALASGIGLLELATLHHEVVANLLLESPAQATAESLSKLLDETGERLRHLSHELRPAILDDLGLPKALTFLAQGISSRSSIKVTVFGELRERPPARVELALYRVVQEALNNAIRHASGVTAISVRLRDKRNSVVCSIRDDGIGFDVDKTLSDKKRQG